MINSDTRIRMKRRWIGITKRLEEFRWGMIYCASGWGLKGRITTLAELFTEENWCLKVNVREFIQRFISNGIWIIATGWPWSNGSFWIKSDRPVGDVTMEVCIKPEAFVTRYRWCEFCSPDKWYMAAQWHILISHESDAGHIFLFFN